MKSTEFLKYNSPAREWLEATPLGNGYLGMMVFGETEKEAVYMNEDTCVSNGPLNRLNPLAKEHFQEIRQLLIEDKIEEVQKLAPRYFYSTLPTQPHYEPLGEYFIEFKHRNILNYSRTLDLTKAILSIDYDVNNIHYHREAFASYPDNVSIYKISCNENKLNFDLYLNRRNGTHMRSSSFVNGIEVENNVLYLSMDNGDKNNGVHAVMALTIKTDGEFKVYGTRCCVENATEATIYTVARTTYRSDNPLEWCRNHINEVLEKEYMELKEKHISDYQSQYNTIDLSISKEGSFEDYLSKKHNYEVTAGLVETHFNFGRYLLISSSRENTIAANMQGIWSYDFDPYWGSRYTINCNTQMNYWPAEKMGMGSEHLALMELITKMYPNAKEMADKFYGMRGAVAHHNTDIWGDCAPADYYDPATIWPFGYVWLILHAMEHYFYTRDEDFIDEYYPIIKDNVLFMLDYLFLGKDGNYHTGPSVSPENTYLTDEGVLGTFTISPEMDIAMVKEFFNNYLYLLELIDKDDYKKEVTTVLNNLPCTKVSSIGTIMEYQKDYQETELGHRHISQLFGLYPGNTMNVFDTPELIEPAYNTIIRRLENGSGNGGWSSAWIACWFARMHKGKEAIQAINRVLTEYTTDNLFGIATFAYSFQFDANLGIPNAVLECLLQDYTSRIYVLPAISDYLMCGSLNGYRTRNGGIINMKWSNGNLDFIEIQATRPLETILVLSDNLEKKVVLKQGEYYRFEKE